MNVLFDNGKETPTQSRHTRRTDQAHSTPPNLYHDKAQTPDALKKRNREKNDIPLVEST